MKRLTENDLPIGEDLHRIINQEHQWQTNKFLYLLAQTLVAKGVLDTDDINAILDEIFA